MGITTLCFKKIYILLFTAYAVIFMLADASSLSAAEVLVVKSSSVKPYNDAIEGFKSTCKCTVRELNLLESGSDNIQKQIFLSKPDAVLAIGMDALTAVAKIDSVPVFYTMITQSGPDFPLEKKNLSGVGLEIPPDDYLNAIAELLPNKKRIGVIYNEKNTGKYTKKALAICSSLGFEIILKEISGPSEVSASIEGLKGKIDLFWMLPDSAVITPQTIEAILLFSFKNNVPVITFSDKYVKKGALAALRADSFGLGAQTGDLVAKRLKSGFQERPVHLHPKKILFSVNDKISHKFGLKEKRALLDKADEVF
jgi:putative tryptophan/tyrosine transport system substrate-binding protein